MTPEAWLTLAITAAIFLALLRDLAPPDVLFVCAATVLAVAGIITPAEAFHGFANSAVLAVAALFVVAAGLRETGVLEHLGHRVLGGARTNGDARPPNESGALKRLAALVIPLSAFLNNTPIVAMFMPVTVDWCRRHRISPSKLLIPLSYLAILGGTCTLIGTSTNLVVNGLMTQSAGSPGPGDSPAAEAGAAFRRDLRGMSLFELAPVGVPYALVGLAYLLFVGRKLLPERKDLLEQLGDERREYLVEMLVEPECRLAGLPVQEAGLGGPAGLSLIEIEREGRSIIPSRPGETIQAGDRIVFSGVLSRIVELKRISGLIPVIDPSYEVTPEKQANRLLVEAVLSPSSPLVGKTVEDADFRSAYGAAVVGVHRNGVRGTGQIRHFELRPGDTVLLQARSSFLRAHRNDPDFYLVSDVEEWRPLRPDRAWIALLLFIALIALMTTGSVDVGIASLAAGVLMILCGCISTAEARKAIDFQVIVTIAASFAVGVALQKTGAAAVIAGIVVDLTRGLGPLAVLAALYLVASMVTELITNNAAAVLLFPLCLETARACAASPRPFLMALVFAASASFVTPIGYQTNMMVYGPGGYRFIDFVRVGLPLKVILWLVAVALIPLCWPF
ncbi:MAG: SLC13 family permease [Planctomycetes bacterium]|nr:SLC13 family permease [Planctomycetota bacterium]